MSYYHYLATGILLLTMAIATLKTLDAGQNGWKNLASNILTVVLVVEFTVWSVDTVLWLVVQVAQYLSVPPFSGHSHLALPLHPAQTHLLAQLVLSMDGYTVVDQVQVTLSKMVHNGVEYGIMQAYAEGFNILHHGNLGSKYVKEGDAEVGSDGKSGRLSV